MPQRPFATVLVESPSAMRETGFVVRIAFHVVMWSAILMTATWFPHGGAAPAAAPATAIGEVAFRELPGDIQRMYRRCLDGLADAEEVRADSGAWPTVEAEAARGVPPFAPDPIDKAGYRWELRKDGLAVNYVGVPATGPAIAITILEPDPGTPNDPTAYTDDQHHRLRGGEMIHVAVWIGTKLPSGVMVTPAIEDGWKRIVMGAS
ncbi:MAG TPA: hypothetical protein VIV58_07915 [Kofleriaceae bacterium]